MHILLPISTRLFAIQLQADVLLKFCNSPSYVCRYINNQTELYNFRFNGVLAPDVQQDAVRCMITQAICQLMSSLRGANGTWRLLAQVFGRVASDVVLGALDGFNGTVFAYGQTGSGKTYTITGGAARYADRGIIPRAISLMFAELQRRSDHTFAVRLDHTHERDL